MEKVMTPRKGFVKFVKVPNVSDPLKQIHQHAGGIDVHAKEHYVAVPVGAPPAEFVNPAEGIGDIPMFLFPNPLPPPRPCSLDPWRLLLPCE
jgi:hypothetical protein